MLLSLTENVKDSPLFKGMKDEEINLMLKCLNPKVHTFSKNEYIVNSGESIDKFGIVLEGEVNVIRENCDGNRVIISVVKSGNLFGEMLVFSSNKIWPVSVHVPNSCKVLFLSNSDIIVRCSKMCPWHTAMLQNFVAIVSDKALMLNKKIEYLTIKSIRGKIATYLLDQYKENPTTNIALPLKRNDLADFLNVSRPSLSREICKMRDEGIIDFHLSTFRIKDIEDLKKYCD
ncbi:Crp/Fnr family transcriptional regulator [Clostridium sp.]|uniref:Crp/Fnr family transcriptional regulator n=1 Tax=Clostridium sp. TaxID=1506 RepID=UPI0032180D07